jgi:hypothetical protein
MGTLGVVFAASGVGSGDGFGSVGSDGRMAIASGSGSTRWLQAVVRERPAENEATPTAVKMAKRD